MSWGIWLEDLETWLLDGYTKDPKNDSWISNPSLWPKAKDAKKQAKELNTMWRGRKPVYEAKEYKEPKRRKKTKKS
jgi:hypothetical protein